MPKIYLIDGNAYIHRAYHALPPLTTSKGEMVNAVYGFIRMVLKLLKTGNPEYLAVCFDHPSPTFRHKEFEAYKATRKQADEELRTQIPLTHEAVRSLNLTLIEKEGFEADDIIATLAMDAERSGAEVIVITGDKDILQIVNERIKVWNEQKNVIYDVEKVREKYGVCPAQLADVFGLMGDAADNVPGIKGIGEKTAVKLIQEYGSLENLLEKKDSLTGKLKDVVSNGRDDAVKSKHLVTLRSDVPLGIKWSDCVIKVPEKQDVINFLCRLEFTSLLKEILPEGAAQECGVDTDLKYTTEVVLNRPDFDKLLAVIKSSNKLSVDLETTSLDAVSAGIVGFSLAVEKSRAFYVPIGHNYLGMPAQLEQEMVLGELKPVLENGNILKYGHNIKYDMLVLMAHGIELKGVHFDSMLASYCLNPTKPSHRLKSVALDYLGFQMTEIDELIGRKTGRKTMDLVEIEKAASYAGADSVAVLRLAEKLEVQLVENKLDKLFYEIEMPLVQVLARMEWSGIKVDISYLRNLSVSYGTSIEKLGKEIYEMAGEKFNLNSPKQLSAVLFEKLLLPVVKRTKTGSSTDEDVLAQLSAQHPLPGKLLEYRELQKLKSTYVDALIKLSDPKTHRIHTSFNQAVTATGRLSSSDPNLQNIPIKSEEGRKIRKAFIPDDGHCLVSADYSQIDLRVLAHISDDKTLINAFMSGGDVHTETAKEVFGVPVEKITPELRRMAKTINFGIVYGISPYGLARQLQISNSDAEDYINHYFERYDGVRRWLDGVIREARVKGYVATLLGRLRYLPEINSTNKQMRSFAERVATNTPVQGTSADIIKVAMINLSGKINERGLKTRMLVQVHDELLFESPDEEAGTVIPLIKSEMEKAVKLKIPVVVDVRKGKNWDELNEA